MAAPSARSFTTTTSPGITRIRKNTAMATPISVGITMTRRRVTYRSMRRCAPGWRAYGSVALPVSVAYRDSSVDAGDRVAGRQLADGRHGLLALLGRQRAAR